MNQKEEERVETLDDEDDIEKYFQNYSSINDFEVI